jgi:hypothetical protein
LTQYTQQLTVAVAQLGEMISTLAANADSVGAFAVQVQIFADKVAEYVHTPLPFGCLDLILFGVLVHDVIGG